jgi:hypothetical protein
MLYINDHCECQTLMELYTAGPRAAMMPASMPAMECMAAGLYSPLSAVRAAPHMASPAALLLPRPARTCQSTHLHAHAHAHAAAPKEATLSRTEPISCERRGRRKPVVRVAQCAQTSSGSCGASKAQPATAREAQGQE